MEELKDMIVRSVYCILTGLFGIFVLAYIVGLFTFPIIIAYFFGKGWLWLYSMHVVWCIGYMFRE